MILANFLTDDNSFHQSPVIGISPHVCNSPIAICTETRSIRSVHITPACGRLLEGTQTLRRHGSMTGEGIIRRSPRVVCALLIQNAGGGGMQSIIGIALLVVGVVLIIFGMQASASVGSRLSELFTGAPSDRTIWLLVAGVAAAIVGVGLLLAGRRRTLQ
jgi:Protein of unknown function (DUF3185)